MKEKLSKSLASLYVPLFLIGGGDTNPGNICVKPINACKSVSEQLRFGTIDIDLSFKDHADSSQFKKHKEICEKFLEKTSRYKGIIKVDKCARNVLNFYGKNPIAVKTENPLLEESYFLETGDSGLRENRANTSIYTDFLCQNKVPCDEKKFDPYN